MGLDRALAQLPTISSQVPELTDLQREALRQRVEREKRARAREERESLVAAAERTCRVYDCGCEDPEDYLTRPLESAHRCPNPKLRTEVVD